MRSGVIQGSEWVMRRQELFEVLSYGKSKEVTVGHSIH